jgi:hypothetical protein
MKKKTFRGMKRATRVYLKSIKVCRYCSGPLPINSSFRQYCSELCAKRGRAYLDHLRYEKYKDKPRGYDRHRNLKLKNKPKLKFSYGISKRTDMLIRKYYGITH